MPGCPSFEGLEYKSREKLNKPESNYVKVKKKKRIRCKKKIIAISDRKEIREGNLCAYIIPKVLVVSAVRNLLFFVNSLKMFSAS